MIPELPAEVAEAWQNVELMPAEGIFPLLLVKNGVPALRSFHDNFLEDATWFVDAFRGPTNQLQNYIAGCRELRASMRELVTILDRTIEAFQTIKPIA